MIDLSDIEKGNVKLPIDSTQALVEILRLSVSNQAMINALTHVLLFETSLIPESERDKIAEILKDRHDSRFNEMWAAYVNAVAKK
ncbi:hypothetical protein B0I27_10776 [Arcticibacter pallidicorallinus]|uniref:Uncharacterized protein n=1 Tax=Arcticibacter pallidicorallinus TaxID=1259464 RepID=A0A2T0U0P8_9SPHI|nr:hypothetical protein [Arcticibacter pallidicorallinus]PRY51491.1 hypothetical protein B0I27_10776 [Arcticibacter pallidicorallinus]